MGRRAWTAVEKKTAIELKGQGVNYDQIAERLGRTYWAVKAVFKDRVNEKSERRYTPHTAEDAVPPPYVLAELRRRAAILPTLDHMLCGTPLPTCSALDRPAGLYYAG